MKINVFNGKSLYIRVFLSAVFFAIGIGMALADCYFPGLVSSAQGTGTVGSGTANNVAYYQSSGTTVIGNPNLNITAGALSIGVPGTQAGSVVLAGATSGTATIQAPSVAGSTTFQLPPTNGTSGYFLQTNGSGITTWAPGGGGGSGTVSPGVANQVGYYSFTGSTIGGDSNLTILNGTLTVGVSGTQAGSLVISGGTSGSATINVPAVAGSVTFTLPANNGTNGYVLTTNGSGVTSWSSAGSGSGTVNSGTGNQFAYYASTGTAVNGNVNATISSGTVTLGVSGTTAGNLVLSGSTSGTCTVGVPIVAGTTTFTLPPNNGTNGYVLQTNGSGVTTWVAAGSGGAVTSVSGDSYGSVVVSPTTGATVVGLTGASTAGTNTFYGTNGSGTFGFYPTAVNTGTGGQLAIYTGANQIGGNANATMVNGILTLGASGVQGGFILNGMTSGTVEFVAPNTGTSVTFILPNNNGSNGNALITDGFGNLSFGTPTVSFLPLLSRAVPCTLYPYTTPSSPGLASPTTLQFNTTAFSFLPVPSSSYSVDRICVGPLGNLWAADINNNSIDRYGFDGTFTSFAAAHSSAHPTGICTGPDGNIWCNEPNAGYIDKIDPTSGSILNTYSYGGYGGIDLCTGPDGLLYTTNGTNFYSITTSGTITQYTTPSSSPAYGIAAGPDGNIWFCEPSANKIANFGPASHSFHEYLIPTSSASPFGLCAGPDGNMWFTEQGTDKIGSITTAGVITEYAADTGANLQQIAAGADGSLWYTELSLSKLGRIQPLVGTKTTVSPVGFNVGVCVMAGPDGNIYTSGGNGTVGGLVGFSLIQQTGSHAVTGPIFSVAGTAGNYLYSEPEGGAASKKLVVVFNGYTNTSTSTITFPVAFKYTPSIGVNGTGLTFATPPSTTQLVIPIAASSTGGTVTVEGFYPGLLLGAIAFRRRRKCRREVA